jgi:hypothetical protein
MPLEISPTQQEVAFDYDRCNEQHIHISCDAVMWKQADGSYKSMSDLEVKPCLQKGTKNRFGAVKDFTCLVLPPKFIHKPVGEWICKNCVSNKARGVV